MNGHGELRVAGHRAGPRLDAHRSAACLHVRRQWITVCCLVLEPGSWWKWRRNRAGVPVAVVRNPPTPCGSPGVRD
eukprot:6357624-Pyramimonas_sp.AAC.1